MNFFHQSFFDFVFFCLAPLPPIFSNIIFSFFHPPFFHSFLFPLFQFLESSCFFSHCPLLFFRTLSKQHANQSPKVEIFSFSSVVCFLFLEYSHFSATSPPFIVIYTPSHFVFHNHRVHKSNVFFEHSHLLTQQTKLPKFNTTFLLLNGSSDIDLITGGLC